MEFKDESVISSENTQTVENTSELFSHEALLVRERALEEEILKNSDPTFLEKIHSIRQRIKRLESARSYIALIKKKTAEFDNPQNLSQPKVESEETPEADIFELRKQYLEYVGRAEVLKEEGDQINRTVSSLLADKSMPVSAVVEKMFPVISIFSTEQQAFYLEFDAFRSQYSVKKAGYIKALTESLGVENADEIYLKRRAVERDISKQKNASLGLGRFINRHKVSDLSVEGAKLLKAENDIHNLDVRAIYSFDRDLITNSYREISSAVYQEVRDINAETEGIRTAALEFSANAEPLDFREIPESVLRSVLVDYLNLQVHENDIRQKEALVTETTNLILTKLKDLEPGEKIADVNITDARYSSYANPAIQRLASFYDASNQFSRLMVEMGRLGITEGLTQEVRDFGQGLVGYRPYFDRDRLVVNKGQMVSSDNVFWWKYFREFCHTKYGEEFTSYADRKVGGVVCQFVEGYIKYDDREKKIKFGHSLFDFEQPEFVPTAILNAYREPGHSGEKPFISGFSYDGVSPTILEKYVENLPPETIAVLEKTDPEIALIIKEILSFGAEALKSKWEKNADGKYVEKVGSYNSVRELLNKYILRKLERDNKSESQAFLIQCFALDKNTPELTDRMLALYNSLPSGERSRMVESWSVRDLTVDQQRVLLAEITRKEKVDYYESKEQLANLLEHLASELKYFDQSLTKQAIEVFVQSGSLRVFSALFDKSDNFKDIKLDKTLIHSLIANYIMIPDFNYNFDFQRILKAFPEECQQTITGWQEKMQDKSAKTVERDQAVMFLKGIIDNDKVGTAEIQGKVNDYCREQLESAETAGRVFFLIKSYVLDKDNPEFQAKILAMYERLSNDTKAYINNNWSIADLNVDLQKLFFEKIKTEETLLDRSRSPEKLAREYNSFDESLRVEVLEFLIQDHNWLIGQNFKRNMVAFAEIKLTEPMHYLLVWRFIDSIVNEENYNLVKSTYTAELPAVIAKCQKSILDDSLPVRDRDRDVVLLSNIAKYDKDLAKHYIDILTVSPENQVKDTLSPEQKAAIYVLKRLDNPDSNDVLFKLVANPEISNAAKYLISKTLFNSQRNFLAPEDRLTISRWIKKSGLKSEIVWSDLEFLSAIRDGIPSTETQKASIKLFDKVLATEEKMTDNLHGVWENSFQSIPLKAFTQIYDWCQGNLEYLNVFNGMFQLIKKEGTMKDELLTAVINTCELTLPQFGQMKSKIMSLEYKTKEDVAFFTSFLVKTRFLNTVHKLNLDNQTGYEKLKNILDSISNVDDFAKFETEILKTGLDIIFDGQVEWKTIEAIQAEWGSAEPIFHYLGRYPNLRGYIGEMTNAFSSEMEWNKWRYNRENLTVADQLSGLSDEQVKVWESNTSADLGDIEFASFSVHDKPRQIALTVREAVLNHQHIAGNVGEGGKEFPFIQKTLESLYGQTEAEIPPVEMVNALIERVSHDEAALGAMMQVESIPKLENTLSTVFPAGANIAPNKKVNDSISILGQFLPDDIAEIKKKFAELKKLEKFPVDSLITSEIRQKLQEQITNITRISIETKNDPSFLDSLGLKPEDQKQQKKLQLLKREMRTTCNLLRLNKVTPADLAQNRFLESPADDEETITGLVEGLQKFFDGNPFANDLTNVYAVIKGKEEQASQKHLGAIFTDNPGILWQVGYYPRNSGSCQDYVGGSHAGSLMGYVGDANTKVLYLFDIDRLSADKRKLVRSLGLTEALPKLSQEDILVASVARTMIKIVKTAGGQNAILIEPTYTSQNKGDKSMDSLIDSFVKSRLGKPIGLKVARGEGTQSFSKGLSRSPGGQYEDVKGIQFLAE